MATATALTNIVGNTIAVFAIARWEGAFNPEDFKRETGRTPGRSLLRPPPDAKPLAEKELVTKPQTQP
jgi:aerobic C4-dicarboxylate transport protein